MRLIKMIGLTALAALAAMAVAGVGSASADVLCHTNVGHPNKCLAPLAPGKLIEGLTTEALLLDANGAVSMKCHSRALGKYIGPNGNHVSLTGLLESLTFSNCTGLCPSAKGHSAPFLLTGEALTLLAKIAKHGNLRPGALLEGCTIFKVNCLFQTTNEIPHMKLENDLLIADKIPLSRSGHSALCPATGFWDAKYLVTLHGTNVPLYAAALS